MTATLVLWNGRIYTQERAHPSVSAVAISNGRIVAMGDDETMLAHLGAGEEHIDLAGNCVVPGLVDSHVHFRSYSLGLQRIDLDGVSALDEALQRIAFFAGKMGKSEWLLGRGWNQAEWPGEQFPNAADLDRVSPHRPVFLKHKSGHAAWANSKALQMAGISRESPDPPGGEIQRDKMDRPTGILFETAIDLVRKYVTKPGEAELVAAMRIGQQNCLKAGLTGIHDYDGRSCFQALQTLHQNGDLQLRAVKNIPVILLDQAIGLGLRSGFGDDWLRIGGVKMFADGALGPRTAALLSPYENEPDNRGIVVTEMEEMMAQALVASDAGLSVTIHAIGDRANHEVLDVYEAIRREENKRLADPGKQTTKLRHRIEHAQLLHPRDIARFRELGVIASMQPIHATSDMEMADRHWGERTRYGYAWRSLLEAGAFLVFGSDAPVESINPLTGIYAAVNRRRPDGLPSPQGWHPEQKLTIAEAISAYSMGAAFTSGREKTMGTVAPRKIADLTIFDRDIHQIPSDELLEVSIAGTMVGGKLLYRNW